MRKPFIALSLAAALAFGAAAPAGSAQRRAGKPAQAPSARTSRGGAETINAAQLRDDLSFFASDELEGRDTPSRGLDVAARFISTRLAAWGLKPAGDDDTYFQRIVMRRSTVDPERTRAEVGGRVFEYGDDFLALRGAGTASGPLVYVGHGWVFKGKNINPYEGLDVRGKIVVALQGPPRGVTPHDAVGPQGGEWDTPESYAKRHGAKGIVLVPGIEFHTDWEANHRYGVGTGDLVVERFQQPDAAPALPLLFASLKLLGAMFEGERHGAAAVYQGFAAGEPVAPFALAKEMSFTVSVRRERLSTQNVVAVLPGGDPALAGEYVAVSAHYDHVGAGPADDHHSRLAPKAGAGAAGDSIYNGADDNGSGAVALLSMAGAFARSAPRPRRSILFVWHAGEEKGLMGSRYFVDDPRVPLKQIAALLNVDMIGRSRAAGDAAPANADLTGPEEIHVIGSKRMSSELGELSERVNREYLGLKFNYRHDDPADPERAFFRSDHIHYARKGIPVIFYMSGTHEDYHRPSDSSDKIDYAKMERVARTIHATAWELANLPARPRVDRPLE